MFLLQIDYIVYPQIHSRIDIFLASTKWLQIHIGKKNIQMSIIFCPIFKLSLIWKLDTTYCMVGWFNFFVLLEISILLGIFVAIVDLLMIILLKLEYIMSQQPYPFYNSEYTMKMGQSWGTFCTLFISCTSR